MAFLSKFAHAGGANKWLLSGVGAEMALVGRVVRKSFLRHASGALVRLLTAVHAHVHLELILSAKALVALGAFMHRSCRCGGGGLVHGRRLQTGVHCRGGLSLCGGD